MSTGVSHSAYASLGHDDELEAVRPQALRDSSTTRCRRRAKLSGWPKSLACFLGDLADVQPAPVMWSAKVSIKEPRFIFSNTAALSSVKMVSARRYERNNEAPRTTSTEVERQNDIGAPSSR